MPSLSNSRTGSTAVIYSSEWGSNPGVCTLDHQILRLRVGLEPGTLDLSSPTRVPLREVYFRVISLHMCNKKFCIKLN